MKFLTVAPPAVRSMPDRSVKSKAPLGRPNSSSRGRAIGRGASVLGMLVWLMAAMATADDWPQWLGRQRDSRWRETGILRRFPAEGPRIQWRFAIRGGYAGPAVAGDQVFVADYVTSGDQSPDPNKRNQLEGTERILCLEAETGKLLWKHEYECAYNISYPAGPRCTPTVDGDRVYTLGAEGDLRCLRATDGEWIWSHSFPRDFQAETPVWGFAGHPLVDGNRLICVVGGPGSLVVAFDKLTGDVLWKSLEDQQPGYSSPSIVEAGGVRQLLVWHGTALSSLDPETGAAHWSLPLDPNYGMSIVTPRMSENEVFVGGIVNKSMLVSLMPDRSDAEVKWFGDAKIGIDPVHSTPFFEPGYLYGVDREGQLCCVDRSDGRRVWGTYELMPEKRRVHSGNVFLVKNDDHYFLFTDSGELVIAKLSPAGYQEQSRAKIIEPTGDAMGRAVVWSHPAFAHRSAFVRNDRELIRVSLAEE